MINQYISYKNYYKFKARIYCVPHSLNRPGIDVYPRFFLRPIELLEVMAYSTSSKSTDDGFEKNKESGLYLKDRREINDTVTYEEIDMQFEFIKLKPPYWYHDETSYIDFVRQNMDGAMQNTLEQIYTSANSKPIPVEEEDINEDSDIQTAHLYKDVKQWTTRTFNKEVAKDWPVEKGVIITKVNSDV